MVQYKKKRITKLTKPMWDMVLKGCAEQLKEKPDNVYLMETIALIEAGWEPTNGNDGWEGAWNNFGKEQKPIIPSTVKRNWVPKMPPEGSSSECGLTRKEYDRRVTAEKNK